MSKVLVMEDDLELSFVLKNGLEAAGYEVVVRTSASDAIEELSTETYDMLISDIIVMKDRRSVPDGGIALIGWVRRSKKYCEMPIIVISGTSAYPGMANILTAARRIGADVALEKPFTVEDLLSEIDALKSRVAGAGA
ncbi:response regulator [Roseobacter sp.]|uniref:response regulator n=1 Tax=Roseobacter sp. TaxID=1907202 RepID=UPI00329757D3